MYKNETKKRHIMYKNDTKKRITLDMPAELVNVIKKTAIDQNCTMTKWVMKACIRELKFERDNKDDLSQ